MKRRIAAMVLAAGGLALLLVAQPARAGVSFSYFGSHGTFRGSFGGFYSHRPRHFVRHYGRHYTPYRRHGSRYYSSSAHHFPRLSFWPARNWWRSAYSSPYYSSRYSRYYSGGYGRYGQRYIYNEPFIYNEPLIVRQYYRPMTVVSQTTVIAQTAPGDPPREVVVTRKTAGWATNEWRVSQEGRRVMKDVQVALKDKVPRQQVQDAPRELPLRKQAVYLDNQAEYLLMLRRGDDGDREKAAKRLKRFATPQVIEALTEALARDGEDDVRQEAAESLGSMLARKALPTLLRAAREDQDRSVRREARKAAQKIEAFYN